MKKLLTILTFSILIIGSANAQLEFANSGGAQSVAFSPDGTGKAFMSVGSYIYASDDGGINWGESPIYTHTGGGVITKVDFLEGSPNYMFLSVFNPDSPADGGFYKYDVNFDELITIQTGTVVSGFDLIQGTSMILISDIVNGQNYSYDGSILTGILPGIKPYSISYKPGGGWQPDNYIAATDEGVFNHSFQYGQDYGVALDNYAEQAPYRFSVRQGVSDGWGGEYFRFIQSQGSNGTDPGKLLIYDSNMYWPPQAEQSISWSGTSVQDFPRSISLHSNGDTIYVGEYDEVAFTVDNGTSWNTMLLSGTENTVLELDYNPSNSGQLIIACQNGIVLSSDTLKSYVSSTTVPTPTTFGRLSFIVESGANNDLLVNISDGDGISSVTVDGTINDHFDISSDGTLSLKDGMSLTESELTGTVTVTDNAANVSTATVSVKIMDQHTATAENIQFLVKEKTDSEFPLEVGIEDLNGVTKVVFDPAGDLSQIGIFTIDNQGSIAYDSNLGSPKYNLVHSVVGDTLTQDIIITDVLDVQTTISITLVVDAVPVFANADWSGNVIVEMYSDMTDDIDLALSDGNGIASITLGGMLNEYFDIDNAGLMTLKDGVVLQEGTLGGFLKLVDSLDREYFFSENLSFAVLATPVYEPISLNTTAYNSNYMWMSWKNTGKFGDIYSLNPAVFDSIMVANLYEDVDPTTENISDYFAAEVSWKYDNINLKSVLEFDSTGITLPGTLFGILELVDNYDDTTSWDITIQIHNNVGSMNTNGKSVTSDATDAEINLYPYDRDGVDTLSLSGGLENYFTIDASGLMKQIPDVNLGDNDQLSISGTVTLVDILGEEVSVELVITVDHPFIAPDSVEENVVAGRPVHYSFEYPVSDLNGLAGVQYYSYDPTNVRDITYFYIKGNTSLVIEFYEELTLTAGDSLYATYQLADNAGNIAKNIVFRAYAVEEMTVADLAETVEENSSPSFQLLITPSDAIESIELSGDIAAYFDVTPEGLLSLQEGLVIDYEIATSINGSFIVTDSRTGNQYEALITISITDIDENVMTLEDFTATVDENTEPEFQLQITPDTEIAAIELQGLISDYFDVTLTGLLTLKSAVVLDFETDPVISGTYIVTDARNDKDHEASITITITDLVETGVHTFNGGVIMLYPNPAKEKIIISNTEGCTISVYNSVGMLVDSFVSENSNFEYNLNHLSEGMYIFNLRKGDFKEAIRVSITK